MTPKDSTPDRDAYLRQHYPNQPAQQIAEALGINRSSVYRLAYALGLKKSAAFHASDLSGRIQRGRTDPRMVASQFKKGLTPWNTGLKGSTGTQDGCRATQFKKGSKPFNTLPVGSYRINADGALERKIGEAKGSPNKRWRAVAELVWIEANGPLPAKHIVVFKRGMFTNELKLITLDRIECISRAEHARRNHPNSRDPELGRLVQLKGAITRQVNRIAKEQKQ